MEMRKAKRLPQEIITEILTRLPAKFIGQYRCVSKQWLNFLCDPQFIKAHHNIHACEEEGEEKLIWVSGSHSLCTSTASGSHSSRTSTSHHNHRDHFRTLAISRKLNFQHLSENWANIVGSCNGLVLVENEEKIQFLVNPTTLKYHAIPNFHLALPLDHSFSVSGLGYDLSTDDYKVVTLSEYDDTYDNDSTFVDVYSVRKGLWMRIECLPRDYAVEEIASGVFLNGALHWLAHKISDHTLVIAAFNLSDEKFLEISAPTTLDNDNLMFNKKLVACKGCLCMFTGTEKDKVDVWTMKEYGVEESWTKSSFIVPHIRLALYTMTEDGAALNVYGEWRVYMKEDQCGSMFAMYSRGAVTFMESLIDPSFSNGT